MFALPILWMFYANAFESHKLDAIFGITEAKDINLLTSLIDKDKVNQRDALGDTPLLVSARVGDIRTMSLLLEQGADINVLDVKKRDILNIAISTSNIKMAKWALANGIDPTLLTSVYQGSALIYGSHQGAVEIVSLLVTAGAPLNRKNNIGWTALLEAIVLGDGSKPYQDIVKILVNAGADISIADSNGITPLQHAESREHSEIASILRSAL
ncbi:hypothetical protein BCT49_20905 [Vibrio lentus]|uniref:Uncharacterized protein n=2 Tax=Vibrio lentus TaxID=136468 RepID=A0A2N7KMU3_9VIBR|nr:hypothetical protein BCT49_20905 [Vibrio lentus]